MLVVDETVDAVSDEERNARFSEVVERHLVVDFCWGLAISCVFSDGVRADLG